MQNYGRSAFLKCGVAAIAILAAATPAMAQDAVEEVVVTGSRIARQDLVSSSPVTTVSGEDIKVVGSASVEEYLNTLPQLVAGATKSTNVTGQADATANLNLRGLGAKRTLVLVNGKRFMASNQQGIVDVNNIPASLVERVEVVTGGASAVYGSDAMAGVVNFILKDKFDGLQVEGQYGLSGQGDAQDWSTSLTFGASGERASVMMYVNYEDRAALRGNERELSRYSTIDSGGVFVRSGTAGRVGGTLIGIPTPNGTGGFTNRDYALDNLIPRPFIAATDTNYELQQDYAIQTPLQRTNVYGRGTYDFTDTIQGYLEFGFNNVKSSAILARTAPNIRETTNVPGLPYNASFVSPQMAALLAARSNPTAPFALRFEAPSQFPKREIAFARDLYRVLGGFEGSLGDWKWDASYSYSHLATTEVQKGDISRRMFVEASTPSATDPTKCASGNPRCVLVTNLTDWSPALVNFLRVDNLSTTELTEKILQANISGSPFSLPAGEVGLAFGAEHRSVSSADNPAPVLLDFASAGFGERNATAGEYDVTEFYGEAVVPLLAGMTGVDYLGLELAARYSDYSTAGKVETYKAGGEWRINSDVRLRALYQRAARAPNIAELFGGMINTYPAMIDPCSRTANPSGQVAALCVAQGVPASAIGSYQQNGAAIEARLVSNQNLKVETSDTVTIGAVWTPSFLPGFNLTLDYFDIKIDDAIERLGGGPQGTLASCFASNDVNSEFCRTFTRSRSTYEIIDWGVPLANVASLQTSGLDIAANYGWTMDNWGIGGDPARLRASLFVTWVDKNTFQANAEAPVVDRVGTVGGDTPAIPEWRWTGQLNYSSSGLELSWQTEFLSSVKDRKYANAILAGAANPKAGIAAPEVDAYFYHNVRAAYSFDRYTVSGGVRNLFDKEAPRLSSPIEGNTDPNTYDVIGRYFFVGVQAKF
jgi:outer membrane receptor protein involved in Fe transport